VTLVLASQSVSRRALLEAANVPFEAITPGVDEEAAKAGLKNAGVNGRGLADALAEFKALKLSNRRPGDLVLGCDQVLVLENGSMLDKARSREEARAQLMEMRGTTHRLISAMVIAESGAATWRHIDSAKMTMRSFSDSFLDEYLDAEWPAIGGCVGCYRLEGLGAQLFSRIEGSQFTVMGLPLLPLLDYLRVRDILAS
jgi:septum formation protein